MKVYKAIWLESQHRWQINATRDGRRKTFTCAVEGRKGERICQEKAFRWMEEGISNGRTTVERVAERWLDEIKSNSPSGKYHTAKSITNNHILPVVGKRRMSELNQQDVQDIVNRAHKQGLTKSTLVNIRGYAALLVKYARKSNLTKLTLDDVEIPKNAPKAEKIILQPADIKKLFEPHDHRMIHAYRVCLILGLRPGEMIALKWDAIKGDALHINGSINIRGEETTGKNKNARRAIAMPQIAVDEIKAQKEQNKKEGIISPFVFPGRDGNAMSEVALRISWYGLRDSLGMSKASLYGLRHTFVSLHKSMPAGMVKTIVGHSDSMDTFGVYGHEVDGDRIIARDFIQDTFKSILKT